MRTAGAAQFSPENFMRHVPPVNVINPAIFTSLQYLNGQRSGRDLVQQRRRASIVTVHLFGEADSHCPPSVTPVRLTAGL